jgi:hypothetical protein
VLRSLISGRYLWSALNVFWRESHTCNQPLEAPDKALIKEALAKYVRPQSEFTDSAKAEKCAELLAMFNVMLDADRVFKGSYDTQSGAIHYGAWDDATRTIHIEPKTLVAAAAGNSYELAATGLHEAGHELGGEHPTPPYTVLGYLIYSEAPFDLLNPGANSCLRNR